MSPVPSTAGRKSKTAPSSKRRRGERRSEESNEQRADTSGEEERANTIPPLGARIRARLGEKGTGSLLLVIRAGLIFASCSFGYVVAMFAAVTLVPNTFLMVAAGTGVGPASPLETQLMHWLTPSLFLIGLIFVLVLVVVRWSWRVQSRLGEKVRHALSGEETGR